MVDVELPTLPGKKLSCCICQFLYCQYLRQCQGEAANIVSLNTEWGKYLRLTTSALMGQYSRLQPPPLSAVSTHMIINRFTQFGSLEALGTPPISQPRTISLLDIFLCPPSLLLLSEPPLISSSGTSAAALSWPLPPGSILPCDCQGDLSGIQI